MNQANPSLSIAMPVGDDNAPVLRNLGVVHLRT